MKRFIIVAIVLCMTASCACAEGSFWGTLGDWFSQAVEETGGWASHAWDQAANWMEESWGDASQWVEQAWNESSQWATDIWGDVSTWTMDIYQSASESFGAWWTDTFNTVTESTQDTWAWLRKEKDSLSAEMKQHWQSMREAAESTAEDKVEDVFLLLLKKLKLSDEDSRKVWDTIQAYAEEKEISRLTAAKLALPFLFQLVNENTALGLYIPPIAIAQYLTGIMEKLDIATDRSANELVEQLNTVLTEQ